MLRVSHLGFALSLVWLFGGCAPHHRPTASATTTASSAGVFAPTVEMSQAQTPAPGTAPLNFRPWFCDVDGGEAAKALAEDRLADALAGFDAIAQQDVAPELVLRARFLAAFLAQRTGDYGRALRELPALGESLPLLRDLALETAASAAIRLKDTQAARGLAVQLPEASEARLFLLADAARVDGENADALSMYREALSLFAPGERRDEARARVVECLAACAPEAEEASCAPEEGLALIRVLHEQSPEMPWTRHAASFEPALAALCESDAQQRTPPETTQAQQAFQSAEQMRRKMRHRAAEKEYVRTVKLARKKGLLGCRARYGRARSVESLREHRRAAGLYQEAAEACQTLSRHWHVRALYRGGQSFMAASEHAEAAAMFEAIEVQHGDHSYADDARLHRARAYLAMGDSRTFLELIATLPELYPEGDMRAEALWIAARHFLKSGELPQAHRLFNAYHETFPIEAGKTLAGRSAYWLGRVEEQQEHPQAAMARYAHAITTAPFSYYMLLSYARMQIIDPGAAEKMKRTLLPSDAQEIPAFTEALLDSSAPFAQGVELMRLGLTTRGRRVLLSLLQQPASAPILHWATAALFREAQQYVSSGDIKEMAGLQWSDRYPTGDDYATWSLAYPTAYAPEVAAAAQESGVSPALIWAVMREESAFNAQVESWANAIGLMQLILPTARAMGKRLGLVANARTLRNPAVNTRLGAAYLAYLSDLFDGHPALMIAAYNAGEGAVRRWRNNQPNVPLDDFVENIPYAQTRGYTKRVLSSYAVYHYLYGEKRDLPDVPFRLAPDRGKPPTR